MRSNLQKKLFALYFSDVDKAHYLRELARILDVDPGNLSRDLHKLDREGIFLIERRGNQSVVRLNKEYPAFGELKGFVAKTVGVRGSLARAFKNVPGVRAAVLYGSVARGREDAASDIDVLIVGSVSLETVAGILRPLEKRFGREINVTIYSPQEFARKKKQAFLKNVFFHKHEVLVGRV